MHHFFIGWAVVTVLAVAGALINSLSHKSIQKGRFLLHN